MDTQLAKIKVKQWERCGLVKCQRGVRSLVVIFSPKHARLVRILVSKEFSGECGVPCSGQAGCAGFQGIRDIATALVYTAPKHIGISLVLEIKW